LIVLGVIVFLLVDAYLFRRLSAAGTHAGDYATFPVPGEARVTLPVGKVIHDHGAARARGCDQAPDPRRQVAPPRSPSEARTVGGSRTPDPKRETPLARSGVSGFLAWRRQIHDKRHPCNPLIGITARRL
jgi:hypothetical protein